jgi:hypothetical protein
MIQGSGAVQVLSPMNLDNKPKELNGNDQLHIECLTLEAFVRVCSLSECPFGQEICRVPPTKGR